MTAYKHDCFMPPGVGCPECTCPDCGVVGLPYVCGSPDDPSGGRDCTDREATNRLVRSLATGLSNVSDVTR